jgi:hypothetical protein
MQLSADQVIAYGVGAAGALTGIGKPLFDWLLNRKQQAADIADARDTRNVARIMALEAKVDLLYTAHIDCEKRAAILEGRLEILAKQVNNPQIVTPG